MARYWPDGRTRRSRLPRPTLMLQRWTQWKAVKAMALACQWVITEDIQHQPWFEAARRDPDVRPVVRYEEGLQGISIKDGRKRARIQDVRAVWGLDASISTVNLLERLFDTCGVGCWAYPSTLGLEVMRQCYPAEEKPQPAPRGPDWEILQSTMTGGRVDTIRPGEVFPVAYELDMNMAYAAAMRSVPSGYPRRTYGKILPASYVHCRWRIPDRLWLPLGPLHIRAEDGTLSYPTEGEGQGWFWSVEIEQAQSVGVDVEPDYGIAWQGFTDAWAGWSNRMWELRRNAPAEVADLIKIVTVAAIGALGSTHRDVRIVPLSEEPSAEPLHDPETGFSHEWGVEYGEPKEGGLLHVASYVRAKVRCWLYAAAWGFAVKGLLISTDYDAVRITPGFADGDQWYLPPHGTTSGIGGWKVKELHNVSTPKARWLVSDEKVRTPGVSR